MIYRHYLRELDADLILAKGLLDDALDGKDGEHEFNGVARREKDVEILQAMLDSIHTSELKLGLQ